MKNNIILIGMPGVGKSTVGVILAKILGFNFLDSDLLIQKEQNRLLKDIISSEGIDGFIAIENDVNSRIETEKSVIATGGSVIYGKEAMAHLSEIGTVIYLKLNSSTLQKRLSNIKNRGVVIRENQSFDDLFNERSNLYEKYADIIISEENCDIEHTVSKILDSLNI